VTERGTRLSARYLDARFTSYREALGWPAELDLHCLRHSYVTHLKVSDVAAGASFDMVRDCCAIWGLGFSSVGAVG
jgi:site-specific recombinase XerC